MDRRTLMIAGAVAAVGVAGGGYLIMQRGDAAAVAGWEPVINEDDHIMGAPDAPVTMIEFASFTCGHCARFHNDTLPRLEERYIDTGQLRLIFRPITTDALGIRAAQMAACIGDERYFALVSAIFGSFNEWTRSPNAMESLAQIGRMAGLGNEELEACWANDSLASRYVELGRQAQSEYQVNATPTFVIGGEVLVGNQSFDRLSQIVDGLLTGS